MEEERFQNEIEKIELTDNDAMWNFPVLIYLCLFALMDFFFCHMFLRDCSPRLSIYLKSVTYQQIQWSKVLVLEMIPVNVLALLLVVFDAVYSIALMNFICTFQPFCCLSLSPIMLDWVEIFNCLYLHVSRGCVENCQETGCVGSQQCFQHCIFTADGNISDGRWYLQEPLYLKWKQWDCHSDCRYYCMLAREEERRKLGEKPVKYHGRWPFRRVYGIQEPVSVSFSALNLAIQFHGWISFFILVNYKLPLTDNRKTYYEYSGLWHIYGVLEMNCWFWAPVFHSR
ncbi:uncharacterized protein [Spinacia oleracea]|uniref:Post-GPI attachment to proteins factor 3 n=1 Tax=Spinacia oleracea TaxID=3562 RepID=A0A9R0I250_SPIOL|nr:uncharacterized protein LOC110781176 [Spinacia oleracea]